MKSISIRDAFSRLRLSFFVLAIALQLASIVAINHFLLDLTWLHLAALLSICLLTNLLVLAAYNHLLKKKFLTPIVELCNSLKSTNAIPAHYSELIELNTITESLHINQKQIAHFNKVIENRALKDGLTGLANRISFNKKLEQSVNINNQYQDSYALIVINIIDFKNINYTYDLKTGDLILKNVAKILLDNIINTEIIARTGDDEFSIIFNDASDKKVTSVCLKVSRLLNKTYKLNDQRLKIKVRVGATLFEPDEYKTDEYFNQAMDAAKASQAQQLPYEIFRHDKSEYNSRRIEIAQEIAKFSQENNLGLYMRYQPKINLSSGELAGLEALTRLNHPELGRIRPDEFIQIAEDDNFISKITDYILEQCIEQASKWYKDNHPLCIAVNVSPKDLLDIDFPLRLQMLLRKYELPPKYIELEVTENVVIEDSRVTNIVLNRIKKLGVGLTIDDFGVGYSGFNNLRTLPFSTLKIDKSFVLGMLNNEEDEIIVTTTIQVAHKLGMKVVAEGIDNIEVAFALTERYCDVGQGFLYSRPVSADIIESEYLRNKKF